MKIYNFIINLWWKTLGRKKAKLWRSHDTMEYGRVITVIHYHDRLLVITERSIWEISDGMGYLETRLLCNN